jgi:hypothetical protein
MNSKLLKAQLSRIFALVFLLSLFAGKAGAYTFDWKGSSITWASASSWTRSGSGGTSTYPGQSGSVDIVRIGISAYTTNQPILAASVTVASVEFGDNGGNSINLTINTGITLAVTTSVIQDHNNSNGGITTTITGAGTLTCASFTVGNSTAPTAPSGIVGFGGTAPTTNYTTVICSVSALTINGNLNLNSSSSSLGTWDFIFQNYCVNNPVFQLNSGTLTVNNIITTNSNYVNRNDFFYTVTNSCTFKMNIGTITNTLNLLGATPLTIGTGGSIDFVSGGTVSVSTVNYGATSGSQTVYSSNDGGINTSPTIYPNLTLSGASAKTVDGGTLSVAGDWNTSGGAVNLIANSAVVTASGSWNNTLATVTQGFGNISVSGNLVNSGTLTLGTGSLTISGNYTNSGTYTQSTGYTVFNGMGQTLTDSGNGTMFNNVFFNGNGGSALTDVISSGNFSVASTGVLNMVNATYLNANGHLTLNSDVNSSATVAAIPAGAGITGNVNVQRFIQGSSASTAKRGYRAITSAVYTGTSGGVHVFDVKYLLNSVFVSGLNGTANGFNVTSVLNNASLYLFREDLKPPPSNGVAFFTTYNWKGISKINNTNAYDIGIQKRLTTANQADTTTTIPVGNGVLFYFRGNTTLNNGTTGGTKTTTPYNYPENVTTTQVGVLNTGTIDVKLWFANAANGLGNKLSYTAAYVNSGTSTLRGGFTFVGNPYAATINWEKYNRGGSNSSIWGGGGLGSTIWVFNEANNQYESYIQKSGTVDTTSINPGTATGSASNMIASGQGFFIKATTGNQSLSFRETAKTSTQPVAATLHNLMGTPKEFAVTPAPLLRLKLVKDSVNTDEIVIRLSEQASNKFVFNEDAEDMGGNGAKVSLSAISADSIRLAIDFVPFPGLQQEVVQLLTDATASGTYQLVNTQLDDLPPLYEMWLKDAFTNDSLKLKANAAYPFTIDKNNPATFGSRRFTVVIRQSPANAYQLLDFAATKAATARQVQLVWKTANEQNYTNFTVERSTDAGKSFSIVGGLQGSGAGTYSLLDRSPVTGQNLYRLKQEDRNDSIAYSKSVGIQFADPGNTLASRLSIYPNPATSNINVSVAADAGKPPYTIQITNTSGFLIRQVTSAQPSWQTSVADLMPGTYIVKVHNSTDNTIIGDTKFVKL